MSTPLSRELESPRVLGDVLEEHLSIPRVSNALGPIKERFLRFHDGRPRARMISVGFERLGEDDDRLARSSVARLPLASLAQDYPQLCAGA